MIEPKARTAEQWVELISNQELPAITSTAKLLDKFSNDDTSSLPKLSQSILHDQALSSCVLKVANSVKHMGHNKVTTISRAAVVLGIHSVKNICLTSKLIEGLLKSKDLSPDVYQRLAQLMASSFYAGLLAKMMVPDYNEDTQEEVYLAAMLYRIGETAFWSIGGELSEQLIKDDYLSEKDFNARSIELIGTQFSEISKGLAKTWNLGDLLEKSLDQPNSRTTEMQIISLADKLSSYIANPPESIDDFNAVLEKICKIKKISIRQLTEQVKQTRIEAVDLLSSYGASALKNAIKPMPTPSDFESSETGTNNEASSQEREQLDAIMQLSQLTKSSKDFNEFLQLTLKSLAKSIGFDRSAFFMITSDKKSVQSRFSFDKTGELEDFSCRLDIVSSENMMAYIIKSGTSEMLNSYKEVKWRNYMTRSLADLIEDGAICLSPIKINNRTIGLVTSQKLIKGAKISADEFSQFCFLIDHLNMCLSIISMK
ncbi:MAG: HDOD domain-containing protein [Colwellia sp.]|nr:HDOD domain-containing protein [Colwellia sp.]